MPQVNYDKRILDLLCCGEAIPLKKGEEYIEVEIWWAVEGQSNTWYFCSTDDQNDHSNQNSPEELKAILREYGPPTGMNVGRWTQEDHQALAEEEYFDPEVDPDEWEGP